EIQIHTEIGYVSRLNEVSSALIATKLERMGTSHSSMARYLRRLYWFAS
ncbi:sialic acid synthase, partial [Haloferax volcanii DS2]